MADITTHTDKTLLREVERAREEERTARINCGDGLVLVVTRSGRARFLHRFKLRGRYPEHWFEGQFPEDISLFKARRLVERDQEFIALGQNPADEDSKVEANPTFQDFCIENFRVLAPKCEHDGPMEKTIFYRDVTHRVGPLARRKIDLIEFEDVLEALRPWWIAETRTPRPSGLRLLTIIERALYRRHLLTRRRGEFQSLKLAVKEALGDGKWHGEERGSLDFEDAPEFMALLRECEDMGARLAEFIILTGVRAYAAIGARWSEIDWKARTWTVPPERLKTEGSKGPLGKPFVIPLSLAMVKVMRRAAKGLPCAPGDAIFPSFHRRKLAADQLHSLDTPLYQVQKIHPEVTPHGFRTTLGTWGVDEGFSLELMDRVLGHKIGYGGGKERTESKRLSKALPRYIRRGKKLDGTEAKGDAFLRRRREVMRKWSRFLSGKPPGHLHPAKKTEAPKLRLAA